VNAGFHPQGQTQSGASSVLRSLVLCDLVDSTALVERLGDREAAELIRKHDRLARTLADRHGGQEIDKTDGFLMMFERPLSAVAFALDYQRGLRQLNAAEKTSLAARVGIHVGEVVIWDNSSEDIAKGAKPVEVEGLVKPVTSRLMNLALPGQILLSNIAYDLAHRAQGELGEALEKVRWRTHGRYRFRGVPDPVAVFEVGEEGLAPLKAPPWSSKAHREVPFWRRPATVVIEAVLLVALIAVPLVFFLRPDPAIAFAKRDWVVVGSLHNLTSESVFDDALESALRIGLEQSRYVNVLPDLKVRDTITRMQRDPDETEIDRKVGSEVAIRDGARALILPTIAEIGGRVRITAELVDPQTQTTVYSETADGIGKESILPSLDAINSRLRVRLGEALATVSSESLPLEKVATSNLDALRLYSMAIKAQAVGDIVQANIQLRSALRLDPGFGTARIELATNLLPLGERQEVSEQLHLALASADRLTARHTLYAEALLADFSSPRLAVEKWQALTTAYPDMFRAQGAYAYFLWQYANDFQRAIDVARRNISEQNPNTGIGHYLLGTLLLGAEDFPGAIEQFGEAEKLGAKVQNLMLASTHAAMREFGKIENILAAGKIHGGGSRSIEETVARITFAIDAGDWKTLESLMTTINATDRSLDPASAQTLDDLKLALATLFATTEKNQSLDYPPSKARQAEARNDKNYHARSWNAHLLFRAWAAARSGHVEIAKALLAQMGSEVRDPGFPTLNKLLLLTQSLLDFQSGKHEEALARLQSSIDGKELYATHITLMELLLKRGDYPAARDQARWLASHRGRAYAETTAGDMWLPMNVAQSNIALLVDAECSMHLGDAAQAGKAMADFSKHWPERDLPVPLKERVDRLALDIEKLPAPSAVR